jgi:hypothetical protein
VSERSSRPFWLGKDERKWDHFRVHVDALRRRCMGPHELAVYCALIAHAEAATGEAHPSEETIGSYFGASPRRVRDAVRWLEENGWIRVDRRLGKASQYVVLPPPKVVDTPAQSAGVGVETPAQISAHPGTDFRAPRHRFPRTPAQISAELEVEPSNENQEREKETSVVFDADVERLCILLADLVEANGSKRPKITHRWLQECDRLLRLDGKTPEQVERAIRWCQASAFWRANILSMPKLREKFETLRLQAKAEREQRGNGAPAPRLATTEGWVPRDAPEGVVTL